MLAALVVIIAYCAFGVVQQAEHLARRLGDPYGSLVLTLSIVVIEVILIMAVMLGPGESATIARDSVMAVSMVILNLVVGLALLVGALRSVGSLRLNSAGSSTYLAMLIVLVTFGLHHARSHRKRGCLHGVAAGSRGGHHPGRLRVLSAASDHC